MAIDVHAHYFPAEYLSFLGIEYAQVVAPRTPLGHLTIDDRLELMDEFDVTAQILSVSMTQPYLEKPKVAADAARVANDEYAALCHAHRGRLYGLAALPLPHVDATLRELGRAIDELGMVGVSIGCTVNGRPLDDPVFEPLYEELDRRSACLVLHPVGKGFATVLGDGSINWSLGALLEDTVAATRLAYGHIPSRFPRMKVIVPHMGGTIPYHFYRLVRHDDSLAAELRLMWFDNVNDQAGALDCALTVFGSDRLLFGTDFPWATRDEFRGRRTMFDRLTPEERDTCVHRRAAELFGIS